MGRLRNTLAVAAVGAALTAPAASAAEAPLSALVPAEVPAEPATPAPVPAEALQQGDTLTAPSVTPPSAPSKPQSSGGTSAGAPEIDSSNPTPAPEPDAGATPAPAPSQVFEVPSIPSSTCASAGVP
ncbi:MAG TPA: hypothetical protein VFT10_03795, partial [Solirubrobacterales bacterium]|nr:hypothetical protein [Solirubrobacterales bacterium]